LFRKILTLSEKTEISLEEEIEILELYLDLEKLRFKKDFTYKLNNEIKNSNSFKLPSLLLQPYVENSIKHGLLHKDGKKRLTITFSEENSHFICTIRDNGIGRLKSSEINERRAKYHKSFSTSANEKRLKLINETSSKKVKLEINDIENHGGTIVKIHFDK
jgi:LytS/YehU family sensor histidine kinase